LWHSNRGKRSRFLRKNPNFFPRSKSGFRKGGDYLSETGSEDGLDMGGNFHFKKQKGRERKRSLPQGRESCKNGFVKRKKRPDKRLKLEHPKDRLASVYKKRETSTKNELCKERVSPARRRKVKDGQRGPDQKNVHRQKKRRTKEEVRGKKPFSPRTQKFAWGTGKKKTLWTCGTTRRYKKKAQSIKREVSSRVFKAKKEKIGKKNPGKREKRP